MSAQAPAAAVIVIPMQPPNEVSPNFHGHWARRAKAVKALRHAAGWATVDALNASGSPLRRFQGCEEPVTADIEIAWCCGRWQKMDDDNAKASCKALIDGISDALWNSRDGHVRIGTMTQRRGEGTVTVTLREAG